MAIGDSSGRKGSVGIVGLRPQAKTISLRSVWRRRNHAERVVREAISAEPGLHVFGTGVEGREHAGEVFVTLTAADDAARQAVPQLLNGSLGLREDDLTRGWRRLELGDWMIRVYPERGAPY